MLLVDATGLSPTQALLAAETADVNYDEEKVPQYSLPMLLPEAYSDLSRKHSIFSREHSMNCLMYRWIAVVSTLVVFATGWIGEVHSAEQQGKTKIVLVGTDPDHPRGSHMYLFECRLLADCLNQTQGVQAVVVNGWPTDETILDDVKALVFYSKPAGEIVLHPKNRPHFEKLMREGVGYVAIHWATGIGYGKLADDDALRKAYKEILGGWFRRPPCGIKVANTRLTQIDRDHPVSRGWTDFDLREEIYLDLIFHEKITPLMSVDVDGKRQIVSWAFRRPDSNDGRSFGTTLGHFHSNFTMPSFRRAIVNGILWSAHCKVPESGASVDLSQDALRLPPDPKQPKAESR